MPPKRTTSAKPPQKRSTSRAAAASPPKATPAAKAAAAKAPLPPLSPSKRAASKSRARSATPAAAAPSPKASTPRGGRGASAAAAKKAAGAEKDEAQSPQLPPPQPRSRARASLPSVLTNDADGSPINTAVAASPNRRKPAATTSTAATMMLDATTLTSPTSPPRRPRGGAAAKSAFELAAAESNGDDNDDEEAEERFDEYAQLRRAVQGVADQLVVAVLGTEEERSARPRRTQQQPKGGRGGAGAAARRGRSASAAAAASEGNGRSHGSTQTVDEGAEPSKANPADSAASSLFAAAPLRTSGRLSGGGPDANQLPIRLRGSGDLTEEETRKLMQHVAREGVMTMTDFLHGAIDGCDGSGDCADHELASPISGGGSGGFGSYSSPSGAALLLATSDVSISAVAAAAAGKVGGTITFADATAAAANAGKEGTSAGTAAAALPPKLPEFDRRGRRISRPVVPSDGSLPLYTYEDAPSWMQHNPFILTAYRCHYSVSMCFRSLFSLHNETLNVWTHLLGLIFFLSLMAYCLSNIIKAELSHIAIFLLFSFGNCLCMGCSAMFHLFSAHHCERVYSRMIMMDYFGITSLIIASFYPLCYYGFSCEPFFRWTYMGIITALGSVGLIGPFFDFFLSDDFSVYRLCVFLGLAGTGVFPLIHVNFLMPAHEATPFAQGIALMLFLYGVGVVIYVFKVPERLVPGRFDVWFHSHQLWHVFVLAASVVHFFTCITAYMRWESMVLHC